MADLKKALIANQKAFGLELSDGQIGRLADYYNLVQEHNPLLHLVGPCSAEEFATRHVLESLVLLKHFPERAQFADVGPGGGLPSIPCLLVREDLKATLIESKEKKAKFLNEAIEALGLTNRAAVVNRQYSECEPGHVQFVTCRALDRFSEKLPHLVRWSRKRTLLLFGGPSLGEGLQKLKLNFVQELIPMSERRFLFVIDR